MPNENKVQISWSNIDGAGKDKKLLKSSNLTDLRKIFNEKEGGKTDIISNLDTFFRKFIFTTDPREYILWSLFVILSYCVSLFDRIPYLNLKGIKGSGKTTLLLAIKSLVYQPFFFTNMTAATMFRLIEKVKPTLFLDEVDNLEHSGSRSKPIFQILNTGYQKDGKVPRVHQGTIKEFSTYCLKAGIEALHPTTEDRCIIVNLSKIDASTSNLITPFNTLKNEGQGNLIPEILRSLKMKKDELISVLKNPESLKIPPHTIYGREYDKWMPLLSLAKIFSTDKNNYFEEVISYANDCINQQKENEANTPENICKSIISEFLSSPEAKSVIVDDKNHSYFTCTQIQEIIIELDQHNYYRNKASVTKILKRIGISVDRRRIDKKGAVSLYKIPNMLFNGNHKVKEE